MIHPKPDLESADRRKVNVSTRFVPQRKVWVDAGIICKLPQNSQQMPAVIRFARENGFDGFIGRDETPSGAYKPSASSLRCSSSICSRVKPFSGVELSHAVGQLCLSILETRVLMMEISREIHPLYFGELLDGGFHFCQANFLCCGARKCRSSLT